MADEPESEIQDWDDELGMLVNSLRMICRYLGPRDTALLEPMADALIFREGWLKGNIERTHEDWERTVAEVAHFAWKTVTRLHQRLGEADEARGLKVVE